MATLAWKGHQIYYEVIENALPMDTLFIHGNLTSSRWWHPSLEFLRQKNCSGRAILVDWRGCGKSSAPRSEADMKIESLAQDNVEILRQLDVKKAHVVGHSVGGLIALLTMAQQPELFAKALLLNPVGAYGVVFDSNVEAAFLQMAQDKEMAGMAVGATIFNNDFSSSFQRQVVVEDAFTGARQIRMGLLNNLKDKDWSATIAKISQETLVLYGDQDQVLPLADSEELARLLPNGRLEKVPGQGHCWNVENPQAFAERVKQFLF